MTRPDIHENYLHLMNEDKRDDGVDPVEFAKARVAEGYEQTSHKYRYIARIPPGMTGTQALIMADPGAMRVLLDRIERQSAETFRRVYADRYGYQLTLSLQQFNEFKKLRQAEWRKEYNRIMGIDSSE